MLFCSRYTMQFRGILILALKLYLCAPLFWVFNGGLPFVIPNSCWRLVICMKRIRQQSYGTTVPANHVIMQYHRGAPQLTAIFALKPNLRPLFWMFWGRLRSWDRIIAFCQALELMESCKMCGKDVTTLSWHSSTCQQCKYMTVILINYSLIQINNQHLRPFFWVFNGMLR